MPCAWLLPNAELKVATYPQLAKTRSATSATAWPLSWPRRRYQAHDALELIDVDYDPLPVTVDPQKAMAKGRRRLHADIAGQSGVPLDGRRRRSSTRRCKRGRRRQGSDRPAAADPDGD
jgi:CO/xanthine dehydrogenase Mo-binding subunit